ncbi:MAG: hypothetical protein LBT95_03695 [Treponema sp.]|jgi:hypothetical protein|nr:hypothetical protein [Treponema sp.]
MRKRFLEYTPSELVGLSKRDFLDGIRASESRVVGAYVCPYAPNYLEKVSNLELAASFGADFITLEGLNPRRLQMPGLPSKNPQDDTPFKAKLQVEMGFDWSVPELKKLVGRPIGLILLVPKLKDSPFGPLYADSVYSPEMVEFVHMARFDFVALCGLDFDALIAAVEKTKSLVGDAMVIEAGIPHGPGVITGDYPPYNLRGVSTPEFVNRLAKAGADIVDIPAVGVAPGFTMDYVGKLVDAVHDGKALAAASIAHSVEGSDPVTVRRAAVDNKTCGVDLYNFAAGGVFESVALPEQLQEFCIAVKGRRHTFRRMCQSPLR